MLWFEYSILNILERHSHCYNCLINSLLRVTIKVFDTPNWCLFMMLATIYDTTQSLLIFTYVQCCCKSFSLFPLQANSYIVCFVRMRYFCIHIRTLCSCLRHHYRQMCWVEMCNITCHILHLSWPSSMGRDV